MSSDSRYRRRPLFAPVSERHSVADRGIKLSHVRAKAIGLNHGYFENGLTFRHSYTTTALQLAVDDVLQPSNTYRHMYMVTHDGGAAALFSFNSISWPRRPELRPLLKDVLSTFAPPRKIQCPLKRRPYLSPRHS
ncbi:hypothetical protein ACG7TL_003379 [Trametes sanguinea]